MGKKVLVVAITGGFNPPVKMVYDAVNQAFKGGVDNVGIHVITATGKKVCEVVKEVEELLGNVSKDTSVVFLISYPALTVVFIEALGKKLRKYGKVYVAVVKRVAEPLCGGARMFRWGNACYEYEGLAEDWAVALIPKFIVHY